MRVLFLLFLFFFPCVILGALQLFGKSSSDSMENKNQDTRKIEKKIESPKTSAGVPGLLDRCANHKLGSGRQAKKWSPFGIVCSGLQKFVSNEKKKVFVGIQSFVLNEKNTIQMELLMHRFLPGANNMWKFTMKVSKHGAVDAKAISPDPAKFLLPTLWDFYGRKQAIGDRDKELIRNLGLEGPYSVNTITFLPNPTKFWLHSSVSVNSKPHLANFFCSIGQQEGADFGLLVPITQTVAANQVPIFKAFQNYFTDFYFVNLNLAIATAENFEASNFVPFPKSVLPRGLSIVVNGSGTFFGFKTTKIYAIIGSKSFVLSGKLHPLLIGNVRVSGTIDRNQGPILTFLQEYSFPVHFETDVLVSCSYFKEARMKFHLKEEVITLKSLEYVKLFGEDVDVFVPNFNPIPVSHSHSVRNNVFVATYVSETIKADLLNSIVNSAKFIPVDCATDSLPNDLFHGFTLQAFGDLGSESSVLEFEVKYGDSTYQKISFEADKYMDLNMKILELIKPYLLKRICPYKLILAFANIPHPDKENTGGEDSCFIHSETNSFGVADGVGGWSKRGIDSGDYSRHLMENARIKCGILAGKKNPIDPKEVMRYAWSNSNEAGSSTALIATMGRNGILHYANLGDSGLMVLRHNHDDSYVKLIQTEAQVHGFNCPFQLCAPITKIFYPNTLSNDVEEAQTGSVQLKVNDVVIIASDGIFDNLWPIDIIKIVNAEMKQDTEVASKAKSIAQQLCTEAEKIGVTKNILTPFQESFTKNENMLEEKALKVKDGKKYTKKIYKGGKRDDNTAVVGIVVE